jgi:hypothetical protein
MKTEEEFDLYYIDMNRLEEQTAEHAFMFVQHSKELKKAKEQLSQAKSELELTDADIGHWATKNPKKYKLPAKPTGPMISRAILRHPKHKRALEKYQKAQELVNSLQIYVNAYEHRKRMISEAVKLFEDQYFAKPYIASSEIKEVSEQLEKKRIRSKSGLKDKRRKRK